MTVGIAEHKGGINLVDTHPGSRTFSPLQAADVVREYMAHFFPCGQCSRHFLGQYDQCHLNRRCDRLATTAETSTDDDWKELALWLWEFHNDVSVRLVNEKADINRKKEQTKKRFAAEAGPGVASEDDAVSVLWPSPRGCSKCFNDDGSWNDDAVFMYLERSYW